MTRSFGGPFQGLKRRSECRRTPLCVTMPADLGEESEPASIQRSARRSDTLEHSQKSHSSHMFEYVTKVMVYFRMFLKFRSFFVHFRVF